MSVRRLLAAAIVLATATIGLGAQPATAATSTPSMVIAPDDGGVLEKGKDLDVSITVANTGSTALPSGRITTSLDRAPVASSTALVDAVANPPEDLQGRLTLSTATVPAIDAGESTTVTLTLQHEDVASILTAANGTRLLYARYRTTDGTAEKIAVSSVVRMTGGSTGQVGFSTVVSITAPAGTTGVVDTDTQQELTGPDGAWTNALRAAEASSSATIALDPAVIASIRFAGSAAPPNAVRFLDELASLPNEFVRLRYADGDVTLERAAGVDSSEPSSFSGVTRPSATTTGPTSAPTPSTDTTSTSTDELTAWNWSDQDVSWPVPHTASSADLTALRGSAVLLPSDDVRDTSARRAAGPRARVGSTEVLVADTTASSLLATASTGGTRGGAALATLTGLLATAAVTGETTSLLATAGRSDAQGLDRVLSTLSHQKWVSGRTLSQAASGTATEVKAVTGRHAPAARVATAKALVSAEDDAEQLGKAVTSGRETLTAPQRLALLGMFSSSWRSDEEGWRSSAADVEQSFSALVGKVELVKQSTPNFVGSDGTLTVRVANGLSVPVKVVVRARVSNGALQFTGTSSVTVQVAAGGQAKGELHIRTIRNGRTDLTVKLATADGLDLGQREYKGATVSAGFDTIVAAALLTALGLLLALGVYRNVMRRRRPRPAGA